MPSWMLHRGGCTREAVEQMQTHSFICCIVTDCMEGLLSKARRGNVSHIVTKPIITYVYNVVSEVDTQKRQWLMF